jgi:CheY-like chemotaxis protein
MALGTCLSVQAGSLRSQSGCCQVLPLILLVEDEVAMRDVMEQALQKAGYAVIATSDRKEVLAFMESLEFDLIITDVLMPEIDGVEVIKAAKRLQPNASILAVSGGGQLTGPELCRSVTKAMGAGVFLAKPFTHDALLAAVRKVMARAIVTAGSRGDLSPVLVTL